MNKQASQIFEFGPFRLDASERVLLKDGVPVSLTPKALETLLVLVQHGGHIVEKDELMKTVWPDAFVEEGGLTRNVSVLRKVLGEDSGDSPYIETVPKRGYRFTASVRELKDGEGAPMTVERHARARIVVEEEIGGEEEGAPSTARALGETVGRRGRRVSRTVLFTALATLAVAVALASLIYLRRGQPLTDRDAVLLADFDNRTGDEVFDETLKQALAVQLEQSPFLTVFSDERVRQTLRFMGRTPGEPVTRELAREICERQGLKAMLTGSIATLGTHYVITLEALNGHTGDSIARAQVEADSKERVLGALGEASSKLREKLGESLASIQKFDAPLEQATTSSLEALKAFSLGYKERAAGKQLERIAFYKRAIEIDPNFALAYARLAIVYRNTSQPGLAAQVSQRAFELRDKVSERERFYISYTYYASVTYEIDKAIEQLELWTRTYPNDAIPHGNLAQQYIGTRQFEKAIEEARESIRLDPNAPAAHSNLGSALVSLNRFDEAKTVCDQFLARKLDSENIHLGLYFLAFRDGDTGAMQRQLEWANGRRDEYLAQNWQAVAAAHSGQLRKARELFNHAAEMAQQKGLKEPAASMLSISAADSALFDNCRETKETAAKALALSRNSETVWNSALALALCGETGSAQSLTADYAKLYPKDTRPNAIWMPIIRAITELRRGSATQALDLLQPSTQYGGSDFWWPEYFRGLAYLREQKAVQAKAEFQKILDEGWSISYSLTPLARLGLARAAALAGDTAGSRKAYEDFFALWKDADPDIPILQQARREYAKLK